MGLIKAAVGAAGGVLADQWKDFFRCDAIDANVLVTKGRKSAGGRSSNTKGTDNIITSGSVILVADGQCMMIVDQGRIAEFAAEPGEYTYDASTEPSIFSGDLGEGIQQSFASFVKRFTFGGEPAKDQRIYYFNTKELVGNKYGTPTPVPFRVVDNNIGLDMEVSLRCFGTYSYRICDPVLFYKNVCGNVSSDYTRDQLEGQLKSELLTALAPAFAKISAMGIRYSALMAHTTEIAAALNEVLSSQWRSQRGLEIVNFGVSSVSASPEDEAAIKELQRTAALRTPGMADAMRTSAMAEAMKSAAKNEKGAMTGFMGMNMAGMMGQAQYQQPQYQPQQPQYREPAQSAPGWVCPVCGATATGKFCPECGAKKPEPKAAGSWTCPTCGASATGKFCSECGAKKPAGVPQYRCDKCGWEPKDPTKPPKFCPECGDPFDDGDTR
ncbi:MAG: SPFH domain-containing protein [Faecousia sp.]